MCIYCGYCGGLNSGLPGDHGRQLNKLWPALTPACRHGFDSLKGRPPYLLGVLACRGTGQGKVRPFRIGVRLEMLRLTAMVRGQTGVTRGFVIVPT